MAKRVQRFRVTSTVMATTIGLLGELIVNLTNNSLHVHDAVTPGGFELAKTDLENVQNATTSQFGRMTPAQVTQLDTATAGVATNVTSIAANVTALGLKIDDILATDDRALKVASAGQAIAEAPVSLAGTYITGAFVDAFQSGVNSILLCSSAAAPTGWTKLATLDNYAFRSTTGTGGGTAGATAFTTAFNANKVSGNPSVNLAHDHDNGTLTVTFPVGASISGSAAVVFTPNTPTINVLGRTANSTDLDHTHSHNHNVRYINTIRIQKS